VRVETYRIRILSKGPKRKKFIWNMFQDYQLALMIIKDTGIIELVALIFQWKQCSGDAKDHLLKFCVELEISPPLC